MCYFPKRISCLEENFQVLKNLNFSVLNSYLINAIKGIPWPIYSTSQNLVESLYKMVAQNWLRTGLK